MSVRASFHVSSCPSLKHMLWTVIIVWMSVWSDPYVWEDMNASA